MTTATSTPTTSRSSAPRRGARSRGIALLMAAYAMIAAATYQGSGFFTPLYHIASTFSRPTT